MKRVLITGGTGMLGQTLVRRFHPSVKVRFTGRNRPLGEALAEETGAEFCPLDLTNRESLTDACREADSIVHCAALSSPWAPYDALFSANVIGTRNLVASARETGVERLIHLSTPSLYFQYRDGLLISEDSSLPTRFCNPYASTKAQAEMEVKGSDLEFVILRPRGIFGPHDTAIVPRILSQVRGQTLWLPSRRNPLVDLTYVDNVADAVWLSLTNSEASGQVFNITNGEPQPIQTILEKLALAVQKPLAIRSLPYPLLAPLVWLNEGLHKLRPGKPEPRLTRYTAAVLNYQQTLDISKARSILGYQPKVSLFEGIQRYGDWHQSQAV